jgi:hypothetical protein
MAWLTRIGPHSGYATDILGPIIVTGLGMGLMFSTAFNTGTYGVRPQDTGVASASVNTGQQLGGSIGTALLNTIAASATASYLTGHLHGRPTAALTQLALIHGYTTAVWWCAGIFLSGAVLCGSLMRRGPLQGRPAQAAPAPAGATAGAEAADPVTTPE